jgi:hypothetical protein
MPGIRKYKQESREASGSAALRFLETPNQAEKDDPQPQVLVALGFLITNWEPSKPSE